jgi:hypothetical protein
MTWRKQRTMDLGVASTEGRAGRISGLEQGQAYLLNGRGKPQKLS